MNKLQPKNRDELVLLIIKAIHNLDENTNNYAADLNHIDVSLVEDFSMLFTRLERFCLNRETNEITLANNAIRGRKLGVEEREVELWRFCGDFREWKFTNAKTLKGFLARNKNFNTHDIILDLPRCEDISVFLTCNQIFNKKLVIKGKNITNAWGLLKESSFTGQLELDLPNLENACEMFHSSQFNSHPLYLNFPKLKNSSKMFSWAKFNKKLTLVAPLLEEVDGMFSNNFYFNQPLYIDSVNIKHCAGMFKNCVIASRITFKDKDLFKNLEYYPTSMFSNAVNLGNEHITHNECFQGDGFIANHLDIFSGSKVMLSQLNLTCFENLLEKELSNIAFLDNDSNNSNDNSNNNNNGNNSDNKDLENDVKIESDNANINALDVDLDVNDSNISLNNNVKANINNDLNINNGDNVVTNIKGCNNHNNGYMNIDNNNNNGNDDISIGDNNNSQNIVNQNISPIDNQNLLTTSLNNIAQKSKWLSTLIKIKELNEDKVVKDIRKNGSILHSFFKVFSPFNLESSYVVTLSIFLREESREKFMSLTDEKRISRLILSSIENYLNQLNQMFENERLFKLFVANNRILSNLKNKNDSSNNDYKIYKTGHINTIEGPVTYTNEKQLKPCINRLIEELLYLGLFEDYFIHDEKIVSIHDEIGREYREFKSTPSKKYHIDFGLTNNELTEIQQFFKQSLLFNNLQEKMKELHITQKQLEKYGEFFNFYNIITQKQHDFLEKTKNKIMFKI